MKARKNTLVAMFAVCALAAGTTSCEKISQQDLAPSQSSAASLPYQATSGLLAGGKYRIFNGVDACARSGGNCLSDVVVVGHLNSRAALDSEFERMTGNLAAVQAFFTDNTWEAYFPSLAENDAAPCLERLRSGQCDIKRLEVGNQVFYYAGAGQLTPTANEVVMPVVYSAEY